MHVGGELKATRPTGWDLARERSTELSSASLVSCIFDRVVVGDVVVVVVVQFKV